MPATSKSQQRLMGMAYACKTGKSTYCPPKIKKIADNMYKEDLEDFAKTDTKNLPEVKESSIYKIQGSNGTLLSMFKDWLTNKDVQFIENDGEFEILNSFDLNKEDKHKLLSFIQKIGLKKIWENIGTPAANINGGVTTLSNTPGIKFVNPPSNNRPGSGDKFDNDMLYGENPNLSKKKKNKNNKPSDQQYVQSLNDFVNKKKKKI